MVEEGVLEESMEVKVIMLNDEIPEDEVTEAIDVAFEVGKMEEDDSLSDENIVVIDPLAMVEGADDIVTFEGIAEETTAT